MSDPTKENVLRLATLSATYNILLQISLRIVTFVANALILRFISRDVLGVINVRYGTHEMMSTQILTHDLDDDLQTLVVVHNHPILESGAVPSGEHRSGQRPRLGPCCQSYKSFVSLKNSIKMLKMLMISLLI